MFEFLWWICEVCRVCSRCSAMHMAMPMHVHMPMPHAHPKGPCACPCHAICRPLLAQSGSTLPSPPVCGRRCPCGSERRRPQCAASVTSCLCPRSPTTTVTGRPYSHCSQGGCPPGLNCPTDPTDSMSSIGTAGRSCMYAEVVEQRLQLLMETSRRRGWTAPGVPGS